MNKKKLLLFIIIFTSTTTINIASSEINEGIIDNINNKINEIYNTALEIENRGLKIDNIVKTINIINDYNTLTIQAINNNNINEASIYINEIEILMSQINMEIHEIKENGLNTNNLPISQNMINTIMSTIITLTICFLFWTIFKIYYVNRIQNMKPMGVTR